jgi:hypothetical protein
VLDGSGGATFRVDPRLKRQWDRLEARCSAFAHQAIALRYQHLPAVATEEKKRANREFLVVGWDPEAIAKLNQSGEGGLPEKRRWRFHEFETTVD